jgi:hypothetical protein
MELSVNLEGNGLLAKVTYFNGYVNREPMLGGRNVQMSIIEDRDPV